MVEQPAVKSVCIRQGCGRELTGRQMAFCSKHCNWLHNVNLHRRNTKRRAVHHLGGKCRLCGYDRCLEALVFHHVRGVKKFGIGARGLNRSWPRVALELGKCILVCANCHAEIHAGLHDLAALVSND